jgi:hypothetical protein
MENVMGQKLVIAAVVAIVALGAGYYAKTDLFAAGNKDARFVLKDTGDGFLRMDTQTGKMSVCRPKASSWVCQAVADDRVVLDKEIARLEGRIGVLKRYIKKSQSSYFRLPSDKEVEGVVSYFGDLARRFGAFTGLLDEEKPVEEEPIEDSI